jgi:hypothetical protein
MNPKSAKQWQDSRKKAQEAQKDSNSFASFRLVGVFSWPMEVLPTAPGFPISK